MSTARTLHRPLLAIALSLAATASQAAAWNLTLIEQADPPAWQRQPLERAYPGHSGGSLRPAITLGLEDAQFETQAAQTTLKLSAESSPNLEAAREAARKAEKAGAQALLLDLPADWVRAVAAAVKLPVLNLGARDQALRESDCQAQLFHLIASERMRADALAQALASRKWSQVLLLSGNAPDDAARSQVAQQAIQRYGLKLVVQRPFKLSTDPRERQLANPLLLTGGPAYDVVWVVDSDGEFARSLPFNTASPRPVVGDGGMVALEWQAQYERYGAPQLSRRFQKATGRAMQSTDWAGWVAGRALAQAALTLRQADAQALRLALGSVNVDGAKGVALQFRPWDRQLRQPLLLSDGQGVQALAPADGVLHPRNVLDTLGADEPEKRCKVQP